MKTTKQQLRQIIKEELEVILTNEEAGELFGEGVEAQLEEEELNEVDMSQVQIIMDAFAQIGLNLSPAIIMGLMGYAFKQAIDADKEVHKSFNKRRRGFAKPEDQQELNEDLTTIMQNLTPENLELIVRSIIQVGTTFGVPMLAAALGKLGLEAAQAARTAGKAKTMIGDKDSGRLVDFLYHEITGYRDFKGQDKQSLEDAEKEFPMAPGRPPMPK